MKVFRENELILKSSVVSIGAFDGLHRGHQTLIKRVVKRARELDVPSVVYTFDPPPRVYFQSERMLTSIEEKMALIKELNVDFTIVAHFNRHYASRPPLEFIKELRLLGARDIWVGPDFRFGKDKEGSVEWLSEYLKVNIHPVVTCEQGKRISSTRIRKLLQKNDWIKVRDLLGRQSLEIH
ncbi:riboflavin kinase/FMN adenylyltransferase [Bacillus thermophilus]|uniref:FAD synthase n=1 Tax=Siminovitchia thermophila TaxID=1245522 RepID=A0ABS2R3Y7_9BACI|nr:FAD synthetase family protein [Siminovitchia thermophila]MBM7714105.1 riboflavin kinase/FMN adenylyltransferase [Siminovitchia thermophila]ONK21695.1 FAD synthetase [Bacillus sp. VT-16-64]